MSINSSEKNKFMDNLHKYKEKPLYDVPEIFFEQFQSAVMQRIAKEEKRQRTQKKWISTISIAASLAVIVVLSCFIFLNQNANNHFYVHKEIITHEDSSISLAHNYLAKVTEVIENAHKEIPVTPETVVKNETPTETIVYRAIDYYVDDVEMETFFDAVYELECYYDY
jgi:hypothetical protein